MTLKLKLESWLFEKCLPIWNKYGADNNFGGFYERLNLDLSPDNINRRTRVAARQIYSFAQAELMGFSGDTTGNIQNGLKWLEICKIPNSNFFAAVTNNKGEFIDENFNLYDHAFILLAFSSAYSVGIKNAKEKANILIRAIQEKFSHPEIGFFSEPAPNLTLKTNPHMHLFEAALAWIDNGQEEIWLDLAKMLAKLCVEKFIDKNTGALLEYFDKEWQPLKSEIGKIIEPGHQYEWAWLLIRFSIITGDKSYLKTARKLVEIADKYGICAERNICINEIWSDFSFKDKNARLWPQTERMKAHSILAKISENEEEKNYHKEQLEYAASGLYKYFSTNINGLYFDKMQKDGTFINESSPTSSIYHIICAIKEY